MKAKLRRWAGFIVGTAAGLLWAALVIARTHCRSMKRKVKWLLRG